jgi:hypothetical protein
MALIKLAFVYKTDIWGHDRVVMCDIFIRDIKKKELKASNLPHNLCTHVLFRTTLKNGKVPDNVKNGKGFICFSFIVCIHPEITCSLLNHKLLITAKPFIDEIMERDIHQKLETEVILNIEAENDERRFGNVYWNQSLQEKLIRSLIKTLRFFIKSSREILLLQDKKI